METKLELKEEDIEGKYRRALSKLARKPIDTNTESCQRF